MKVIIAGGRNYRFTKSDHEFLAGVKSQISEVVTGGCSGADAHGESWACENEIPVTIFPAEWDKYGKAAGPIRNEEMAKYADGVILFPGGKGTKSMHQLAINYDLKVWRV